MTLRAFVAVEMDIPGIEFGKKYPLRLQYPTPNEPIKELVTLQYRFKPPVDECADGTATVTTDSSGTQTWTAELKSAKNKGNTATTHNTSFMYEEFTGVGKHSDGESLLVFHGADEGT